MSEGWIKIHRRMLKNPVVMKDSDHVAVWLFLLMNASHLVHNTIFDGKKTKLKPGELISGRCKIALALGVSQSKVERILKTFKSEQMIRQRTCSTSRLISIINWEGYQITEQAIEQRLDSDRTASEQRVDTIQEYKELKNGKNGKKKSAHAEKVLTDQVFIEPIRMNWRLSADQLDEMLSAFDLNLIAEGKTHKEYIEYRKHFHNWAVKKYPDYQKQAGKIEMVH